jgi:hypothetical protein
MKLYHNGKLVEPPTPNKPFEPWLKPSIEVHPDLKAIWKEGQEVEEGKDYTLEYLLSMLNGEWQVIDKAIYEYYKGRQDGVEFLVTAVPVKEESEDVWEEAYNKFAEIKWYRDAEDHERAAKLEEEAKFRFQITRK